MSRLTEAPPLVVLVTTWKAGAVVDLMSNAALRWLCRGGAHKNLLASRRSSGLVGAGDRPDASFDDQAAA